jgi:endonuclease/exonuclease/phosphatase family metal-dependent hydrolase
VSYRIGSFNVLNLSGNESHKRDDSKAVVHIAKIIQDNNFDIVAFQELLTPQALNGIVNNLGKGEWEGIHASKPISEISAGQSVKNSREYGFVWKKDRVTLVRDPYIYTEIEKRIDYIWQNHIRMQVDRIKEEPELKGDDFDDESSAKPSSLSIVEMKRHILEAFKTELIRPPMVACFRPAGFWGFLKLELRIINTHIIFSGGLKKPLNQRIAEFKQIVGKMHTALNTLRFGDFRSVYTIVAGDYNLTPDHLELYEVAEDKQFLNECENHIICTVQKLPTTLKTYDANIQGNNCYSKSYDHFSYDRNRFSKISNEVSRVDCNDFKKHRMEISDHVPIYIELNF